MSGIHGMMVRGSALEFLVQPRPCISPDPFRRTFGKSQGFRGLNVIEPHKEAELDQLGALRVVACQPVQSLVDCQQLVGHGARSRAGNRICADRIGRP